MRRHKGAANAGTDRATQARQASERVVGLYHDHAALWRELRSGDLIEKRWLDRFVAIARQVGPELLDLGCGTGEPIARYLIERGCRVTGVDGAAAQIEAARLTFPEQVWIKADMRDLPELGAFDGVLAWHSLFHLRPEDQRRLLARLGALCRPGAALMFTSGTSEGEEIGEFAGQPLYHGSLDRAEYRARLERAGFEVIAHQENDPACGGATVWLARKA
ncbi:class I SAM-dependent DNA methyltransferase [Roseovarius nubinhibens]|uniref:class I SAM-dependent DNA methyltransferase n=1 Tax=Roseovarius nubinhibens TaxID=314263 RepID=UPI001FE2CFC6|nr:class I SAM-dependent methyltransferase [Roseovarius nubinhibens]